MTSGGSSYPFMESEAGELTVGDVERLLSSYKDVVRKYTGLCRAVQHFSMYKMDTALPHLEGTDVSRRPEEQTEVEQRGGVKSCKDFVSTLWCHFYSLFYFSDVAMYEKG